MPSRLSFASRCQGARAPRRANRGFTLIELLVVIAIIAILVALLLPAVQSVREAARATQCRNNIRQVALATIQYSETYSVFPAKQQGTIGTSCDAGNGQYGSGIMRILPFMEQNAVYNEWASPLTIGMTTFPAFGPCPWGPSENNYRPYMTQITALICPSDPGIPSKTDVWAATNYKFSVGDSVHTDGTLGQNSSGPTRGAFGNHAVRISTANMTDGTSNTILIGERLYPRDAGSVGQGIRYNVGNGILTSPSVCFLEVDPANKRRFNGTGVNTRWGYKWYHGAASHIGFTTVLPPNAPACASAANDAGSHGIYPPSSNHAGGAHVVMGDGVVRFISENIDTGDLAAAAPTTIGARSPYGVWGALGSVGGGESVGNF